MIRLTVSQLGSYVQRSLQADPMLRDLEVTGELSNVKLYRGGILFFTLKDQQAAVSCVMYADAVSRLPALPQDGLHVLARGSVTLYVKSGQYQLAVRQLSAAGVGPLYARLQAMRAKLAAQGLFDEARKKPVPRFVDTLGVVTSPTGAVIRDILQVSLRRNPQARVLLCPSRVQGVGADEEVARAIAALDSVGSVSAIIVARGGGSIEDLWTFNEERVVRAVAACGKPVISAVGHETDVTLCDLAADLRAPTPSAAAELAMPLRDELLSELASYREELGAAALDALQEARARLDVQRGRLLSLHPRRGVERETQRLAGTAAGLRRQMRARMEKARQALSAREQALGLVSPLAVLERGYAIVQREGAAVRDSADLRPGDLVRLRFGRGGALARIEQTEQTGG